MGPGLFSTGTEIAFRAILALVIFLAIEFLLLFIVAPTLFAHTRHGIPAIPALWAALAYCLFIMLRDPKFERGPLWDIARLRKSAPAILGLFAVAVVIGIVLVLHYAPEIFLDLPRSKPLFWSSLMLLYPVLSVYPQGIVYRAFIFGRYRGLFGSGSGMVLASAMAFAYVHIVFRGCAT